MLFYSPHAAYQVICSKTLLKRHPVTGDVIETVPAIWAKFGKTGPEYSFLNPETGETMTGAHIVGHYFDTELEAAQNGWDDETREMVERKLLALAARQPEDIRLEERDTVIAKPWPTFDDLDADKVAETAILLGLAAEALAYEQANKDRPLVVDALNAHLNPDAEPAKPVKPQAAKPEPVGSTITV